MQRGAYPPVFSVESNAKFIEQRRGLPMSIVLVIFFFVTAIVLGPLVIIFGYLYSRRRGINKRELQSFRNDIAQMRADIEEIKEQIADFIIKTH
jgi:hypothetical protein